MNSALHFDWEEIVLEETPALKKYRAANNEMCSFRGVFVAELASIPLAMH